MAKLSMAKLSLKKVSDSGSLPLSLIFMIAFGILIVVTLCFCIIGGTLRARHRRRYLALRTPAPTPFGLPAPTPTQLDVQTAHDIELQPVPPVPTPPGIYIPGQYLPEDPPLADPLRRQRSHQETLAKLEGKSPPNVAVGSWRGVGVARPGRAVVRESRHPESFGGWRMPGVPVPPVERKWDGRGTGVNGRWRMPGDPGYALGTPGTFQAGRAGVPSSGSGFSGVLQQELLRGHGLGGVGVGVVEEEAETSSEPRQINIDPALDVDAEVDSAPGTKLTITPTRAWFSGGSSGRGA